MFRGVSWRGGIWPDRQLLAVGAHSPDEAGEADEKGGQHAEDDPGEDEDWPKVEGLEASLRARPKP
jgi:hypothetical protein